MNSTAIADDPNQIGFELQRRLEIVRPRHAVAHDRRLERDHRPPRVERGGNLVGKIERNAQYLTEQPYGVVLATVTGLPASVSPSAART